MAFITVSQLKAAVASIPNGANNWEIDVPDDVAMPVLTGRVTSPNGSTTYLVRGYVDLAKLSWTSVQ